MLRPYSLVAGTRSPYSASLSDTDYVCPWLPFLANSSSTSLSLMPPCGARALIIKQNASERKTSLFAAFRVVSGTVTLLTRKKNLPFLTCPLAIPRNYFIPTYLQLPRQLGLTIRRVDPSLFAKHVIHHTHTTCPSIAFPGIDSVLHTVGRLLLLSSSRCGFTRCRTLNP